MIKILVNGGGSSPYDLIAQNHGWKLGINSGGRCSEKVSNLFMIDNNFSDYNHQQHLDAVKKHHPHLATVRDIEENLDQDLIYHQALELKKYCDRLIIIPKTKITKPELLQIPNSLVGLPLGRFENKWCWHYAKFSNHLIHLLGGSPKHWREAIDTLGYSNIYSADGNYLCRLSNWGKIYLNFSNRKPYPYEVESGKDFNYRCFNYTLSHLPNFKELPTQLSLF